VVDAFVDHLEVATLAEHLGTSRTLVRHPATMTHASLPSEQRKQLGLTDGLVRVSVGLEAAEDGIADVEQALDRVVKEVALGA